MFGIGVRGFTQPVCYKGLTWVGTISEIYLERWRRDANGSARRCVVGRIRGHNCKGIIAQQRVAQYRCYYIYYSNLLKADE
jgi:hypothetical protein